MSEWTRPAQPVRCVVELDKPLAVHRERGVLAQGDANANDIVAEVYSTAGKPYDLTGCTVQLIFVRPDNNALPAINAEISGNTATATLTDSAYAMSGMYSLRMQLHKNGAERTIVWIIGEVKGTDVDGIADPEHVISIGDIMASAKEAQTAASAANIAAERANAGAERAEQLQIDASGLAGDSNKLGDKEPEYYLQPWNLLVNSYFRNPVEQAGRNGLHGTTKYAIDRWMTESGANAYGQPGSDLVLVSDKTNWIAGITQSVDVKLFSRNKVYTFAVYGYINNACRLLVYNGGNNFGANYFAGNATWETYTVTFTIPDTFTGDYIRCMISTDTEMTGNTAYLGWAALYEGSYTAETLPPYVPKGYTTELMECQRYLHRFRSAEMLKTYCDDFCPPMRQTPNGVVSTSELNIDGVTYYFANAEL